MNYYNPTKIHFGNYAEILAEIIPKCRVALFYGESSMKELGAIDAINVMLPNVCDCGGITPNPTVEKLTAIHDIDYAIAIGGGSVIDFAKLSIVRSSWRKRVPLIAIPTTAGTGSEVTPFATLWGDKKHSVLVPFPTHAIIDPELTLSLPPYETAYTGFDALSHAFEAYWSKNSNLVSDPLAISALETIMSYLSLVIRNPNNLHYRTRMAEASLWAGLAISNTKTTAVHAVSYPMTIHYGVPHGVACSLTLAEFWKYNMGEKATYNRIKALIHQVNLPTTLREVGVTDIELILDGVDEDRLANNPVALTRDDLRGILQRVY
ncbi:MAG: phosphonoacetaldehyde reductase [Gammaproteobacteria bacterium]|nr:phosphonoacetaldehyde reductase [Gammaproteobacteria bacterium]